MYRALMKDRKPQEAAPYYQEYNSTIGAYRIDYVDLPKESRKQLDTQ
jgi:hypothetical protein